MAEQPSDFTDLFDLVSHDAWRERVERDLKGADFERRLVTRTPEGIDIQPVYSAEDIADLPEPTAPGTAPYARGTQLADAGAWQIRQEYAAASVERVREEIAEDLAGGVEAIGLRLDRATRLGLDADHPSAREHVGTDGAAVPAGYALARALGAVDLATTHIAIDAGANTLAGLGMLVAVAERARVRVSQLSASVAGDPLSALAVDGQLPGTLGDAWDHLAAAVLWTRANAPKIRPWVVSSRPWHMAGGDCATELGFTLAAAVDGLRALGERGIDPLDAAAVIELQLFVGRDQFMEIAKIRAARLVWHRALEVCGVGAAAAGLRVHAISSPRTRSQRDPWVNMLRGTSETFAAIAGGADSITTTPFDSAIGPSDSLARRLARNTQLVLRLESHLAKVADPAGGSWYVERLTHELAERAWDVMQRVEALGGLGTALLSGEAQALAAASAERIEAAIKRRQMPITGVSNYANPDEELPLREPTAIAELRAAQATAARRERESLIDGLPVLAAVKGHKNRASAAFATALIEAARAGASVGALAEHAFSRPSDSCAALAPRREADLFEALVDAADAFGRDTGAAPTVFVAAVGPLPKHTARASWATHLLHAGGLRTLSPGPFADSDTALAAFGESGASAAIIVAHDALYPELVPTLGPALHQAGARVVLLAGRPPDPASFEAAGVDGFAFVGCDVHALLVQVFDALEVPR